MSNKFDQSRFYEKNNESFMKADESPGVTIFPLPVDSELYIKIDDAAGKNPQIPSVPFTD